MKHFKIKFSAKVKGALGSIYNFERTVEAENADMAVLSLYKMFDHIRVFEIEEVEK